MYYVLQTMSASLFDGEEIKKIGDQFSLSAATVGSHFASLMGYPANPSDAQKSIEKLKNYVNSGISDVRNNNFLFCSAALHFFIFISVVRRPSCQIEGSRPQACQPNSDRKSR